jgi:FKBP-type peptidyl-prolyl cis-trans isomerase FkpA
MKSFPSSRLAVGALLASLFALPLAAQPAPAAPAASGNLEAYEQFGSTAAKSAGITDLNWSEAQFAAFVAGLRAAQDKRPVPMGEAGRQLLADTQRRLAEVRAREKAAQDPDLEKFLATARVGLDLQQTDSGLLYRILKPGSGPRPRPGDMVVANFIAKQPDGRTEIPALSGRGLRVQVGSMPPGVNEGLQMITLGGHALLVIPPHLSFGTGKWPEGIEPGSPILLQVELQDILPAGTAP